MSVEYKDIISPRIADINYGGHLGHVELINLLHETRVKFLNQHSLSEVNMKGYVLVMRNLNVSYTNEAFWANELNVNMQVNIEGVKIIFNYQIFNATLNNKTAIAEAIMVLLDKEKRKPVKPDLFKKMLSLDV